jgi:hydrocephalus-inducing protein
LKNIGILNFNTSVCKRLELFNFQSCVYAEDDRVFYFGAYLAGQQIQVHFKITNPFKISCDISFSVKPRSKGKLDDFAFDVEPKKQTIPSHESRYITATFHPISIQSYTGLFEAVVDNISEGKNRVLSFELRGEGTLPRVSIEKPTMKYAKTGNW